MVPAWGSEGAALRLAGVVTVMVLAPSGSKGTHRLRFQAQQVDGMLKTRPKPCGRRCRSPHPARNHGGEMLGHRPQNLGVTKPRLSVGAATASDVVFSSTGPLGLRAV